MGKDRFFTGFAMATAALGVALLAACLVAWGLTAAGVADVEPSIRMWQSAGGLVLTGLALRWLFGVTTKTGPENH